ncbi:MAG: 7-cyano-7-deazaguanine synthase QueC [Deltaproteobacteria bacterium]|nr:7-cyano-7-deazaguanine synthase QueC [Deltaproteobacteria bacterium]
MSPSIAPCERFLRASLSEAAEGARWLPSVLRSSAILGFNRCSKNRSTLSEGLCDKRFVAQKAVVLLSGGLDSTTVLAIARSMGFEAHALSFRYGQRHLHEISCAKAVADRFGVAEHVIADIDLRVFGGSALTSAGIAVPKDRDLSSPETSIPVTYVPARNTIFLSFALAYAEVLGSSDIFIGVNALDYSGYPDCRPEFIHAFETMSNLATKAGVEGRERLRIHTPLIASSKAEIVRQGVALGVDYGMTSTCYDPAPDGAACGHCDACALRLKAFSENGLIDPARYVS